MATPSSPTSARLSTAGFHRLYEGLRNDPAAAKAAADALESNPRAVLHRYFRLTKAQEQAIANTSDDELRRRCREVVTQLRSASPGPLTFHAREKDRRRTPTPLKTESCTCIIGA